MPAVGPESERNSIHGFIHDIWSVAEVQYPSSEACDLSEESSLGRWSVSRSGTTANNMDLRYIGNYMNIDVNSCRDCSGTCVHECVGDFGHTIIYRQDDLGETAIR